MTCTALGTTTGAPLDLCKPREGETGWSAAINENADKINAAIASIQGGPSIANGGYMVRHLVGETTATGWAVDADLVVLRDPATNVTSVVSGVAGAGCDLSIAGLNGLDVGLIAPSTWYHCYLIWSSADPTVVSTISSLTPPPVGPALPATFTAWAYLGALRVGGATTILPTRMRGSRFSYVAHQVLVAAGAPAVGVETAVNAAALVPPNALSLLLDLDFRVTGSVTSGFYLTLREATGQDVTRLLGIVPSPGFVGAVSAEVTLAELAQQFFYLWTIDSGVGSVPSANIFVRGYEVPSGS